MKFRMRSRLTVEGPAGCLGMAHRQRVMVLANKSPQVRPDLAGSLKASGLGRGFLVFG